MYFFSIQHRIWTLIGLWLYHLKWLGLVLFKYLKLILVSIKPPKSYLGLHATCCFKVFMSKNEMYACRKFPFTIKYSTFCSNMNKKWLWQSTRGSSSHEVPSSNSQVTWGQYVQSQPLRVWKLGLATSHGVPRPKYLVWYTVGS